MDNNPPVVGDIVDYKGTIGVILNEDNEYYLIHWFQMESTWEYYKAYLNLNQFKKVASNGKV
jgi:hypothetical protein